MIYVVSCSGNNLVRESSSSWLYAEAENGLRVPTTGVEEWGNTTIEDSIDNKIAAAIR